MRFVIQRVSSASVTIDGKVRGEIGKGFVVLIGSLGEDDYQLVWMAQYGAQEVMNTVFATRQSAAMRAMLSIPLSAVLERMTISLYGWHSTEHKR